MLLDQARASVVTIRASAEAVQYVLRAGRTDAEDRPAAVFGRHLAT